jgi:hypothetical protein
VRLDVQVVGNDDAQGGAQGRARMGFRALDESLADQRPWTQLSRPRHSRRGRQQQDGADENESS